MLRDVVVHINNEQPIMVDLLAMPSALDIALICQNVRTMAGKKPVFVDKMDSTFVLPLAHVRFIEMPKLSLDAFETETGTAERASTRPDEDAYAAGPLARLAWLASGEAAPAGTEDGDAGTNRDPDDSGMDSAAQADPDGLDIDLLRRIREA